MSDYRVYNRTVNMKHLDPDYICVCLHSTKVLRERFPNFFKQFNGMPQEMYLGHLIVRKEGKPSKWWLYALDLKPEGERYRGSDRAVLLHDRLPSEADAIEYVDALIKTALPFAQAAKLWPIIPCPIYLTRDEENLLRSMPQGYRAAVRSVVVAGLRDVCDYAPAEVPTDPNLRQGETERKQKAR